MTHRHRNGLGKRALAVPALALAAGTAAAGGPELGCWARDYSDAHLARNPDQVVDQMVLSLHEPGTEGEVFGTMWVQLARQGHVLKSGHGGRVYKQFLICWREGGALTCGVECDGGTMTVSKLTADSLTFRTDYLIVGDEDSCGGVVDLAERPGQAVSYRLNRASASVCGGLN